MKPRQKINNTQSGNRMQYVCNINMNQMFVHDSTEPLTHIHTKTHTHTGKKKYTQSQKYSKHNTQVAIAIANHREDNIIQ